MVKTRIVIPIVAAVSLSGCAALRSSKPIAEPLTQEQKMVLNEALQNAFKKGIEAGVAQIPVPDQTPEEFKTVKEETKAAAKKAAGDAIETGGQVLSTVAAASGVGLIASPFILAGASILSMFIKRKNQ